MESLEEKKWEGHRYSEEAVVYTGQNTHDVDDIQARAYGVSRGRHPRKNGRGARQTLSRSVKISGRGV